MFREALGRVWRPGQMTASRQMPHLQDLTSILVMVSCGRVGPCVEGCCIQGVKKIRKAFAVACKEVARAEGFPTGLYREGFQKGA